MGELESQLKGISQTFSSRMQSIVAAPKTHRPTKSTVSDLTSIEEQFRNLLLKEEDTPTIAKSKSDGDDVDDQKTDYMENEIIKLNQRINELTKYKAQVQKLKNDNKVLSNQLTNNAKQSGSDEFYKERADKLSHKVGAFQQNIYNLLSLLTNVEQEYMSKCGKLPKVTRAIDWRNEYDPKKVQIFSNNSEYEWRCTSDEWNFCDKSKQDESDRSSHEFKEEKIKKEKECEAVIACARNSDVFDDATTGSEICRL